MAIAAGDFTAARREMIDQIRDITRTAASETGIAEIDPKVLAAMAKVPRHELVPPDQAASAYRNRPLPIGQGQTISQPFIVALMTHLAAIEPGDRVLEVGTGSGYQAAVLSRLAAAVYSIEIIRALGEKAARDLARLGYGNVHARIGDGYRGWPEEAPFDAIIVTAAPDHVPPALIEQLKPGGRLVIPVGSVVQELMVVTKNADGSTVSTAVVPVQFVPLTRD